MKKDVIGLRVKYLIPAVIFSLIGVIAWFLPYISMDGEKYSVYSIYANNPLSNLSILIAVGMLCTLVGLVLGVIMLVIPKVILGRIWVIIAAIPAVCYSVLLFVSKGMLDKCGVLPSAFMVKNFSFGYWISLVMAFVTLFTVMKLAKINTGYIVLVILSIIWLFPVLWIVLTSLRAESGFYVGYFFPKKLTFDNYIKLFDTSGAIQFGKWWTNTLIVAVCTCVLSTIIILATAYTLSRTRFSGRKTLMQAMLIIGMFPGFMSMIAVYNILKGLGLAQTLVALVVVAAAGAAMGYYVCKGFFDTIPKALDEAAIIDGATRWQIFTRITIPLSKPIIIYTIMTTFLGAWSDYIFPSMVLGDNHHLYTVAIGLYWMRDFRRIDTYYTQFAAGAVLVALPIVILFIWLQKYYVEGLSGSVKG